MAKKEPTPRQKALAEHLLAEGYTAEEIAWASEQPQLRQAIRSFNAGWAARHKAHEVLE